jgi:hypothetical protein
LATVTSTITIIPNIASGVPTISASATMLAPPPIQLPDSAVMPSQVSAGTQAEKIQSAIGAPMITPAVPASIMISALGPRRMMPGTSSARISSIRLVGSR